MLLFQLWIWNLSIQQVLSHFRVENHSEKVIFESHAFIGQILAVAILYQGIVWRMDGLTEVKYQGFYN